MMWRGSCSRCWHKFGVAARRSRRRESGLKEVEFHTLAILQERGTMIVGDIQRLLGVLPARNVQRIIRAGRSAAAADRLPDQST